MTGVPGEASEPTRGDDPTDRSTVLVGVDGCRAGWVAAVARLPAGDGPHRTGPLRAMVHVSADLASVVGANPDGVVALDIPIGLPETGPRACDLAARRLLGPRRASVFPAPARAALEVHEQGWEACLAASRRATGTGLSLQAYHLLRRIDETDRLLDDAPRAQLVEAHPELAFTRLIGAPPAHPKRSAAGRAERVAALDGVVTDVTGHLDRRPAGCAADDLLDALALLATARRLARGTADLLGDGARDGRDRPMTIAW